MFDVSIIIVSYNTQDLTLNCLRSLDKSTDKLKKEVILVDNASHDNTIHELQTTKFNSFELIIIKNESNSGFSKATNQGIKIARGKYILLLNTDTAVRKNSIEKLVDFADNTQDAGAVVPKLLNPDDSIQASVFRLPTVTRAIKQYWFGQKGILDKYYPKSEKPEAVESAVMAAFLLTPSALKNVGSLNENFFMYYEDLEYCKRINNKGLKVYYLPTSQVIHNHGGSGKNITDEKNQWRRLIPSSKIYHGTFKHYLFNFILWTGQKIWQR